MPSHEEGEQLMFRLRVVGVVLVFAAVSVVRGEVIHVDPNATGSIHDGSSWCAAFTDLQNRLAAAGAGDEIHVADGRFKPHPTDRNVSFGLQNGVSLRGGYAGCGAVDPDARDTSLYESILTGDLNDDDSLLSTEADCASAGGAWYGVLCDKVLYNNENSYQVVTSLNNDASAVLDGFTISDGNADGPSLGPTPDSKDQGSGVNIYYGKPTLLDCVLKNNRASNHGAINDHGGGTFTNCEFRNNFAVGWAGALHNQDGVTTTVRGCRFLENATAGKGGAMAAKGTARLDECLFSSNRAAESGGAIWNEFGDVALSASSFLHNRAVRVSGGGLYGEAGSRQTFSGCDFVSNEAGLWGGGVRVVEATLATLTDCTFEQNIAGADGGGISTFGLYGATLLNCHFQGNYARWQGGGVYSERSGFGDEIVLTNCSFVRNSAGWSGAMRMIGKNSKLTNCTFNGNEDTDDGAAFLVYGASASLVNCTFYGNIGGVRGGLWLRGGTATLANCIFWRNGRAEAADEAAQIYFESLQGKVTEVAVNHSSVQGWTGVYGGVGNTGADPQFVDPDGADDIVGTLDDDLRLLSTSPCIDAGDNSVIAEGEDLDGSPRFLDHLVQPDTGIGPAPIVDMGAFEHHLDCNGNGIPDPQDILAGTAADLDANGIVDHCEVRGALVQGEGCRYLLAVPQSPFSNVPIALRVTSPDFPCLVRYVGPDGLLQDVAAFRAAVDWSTTPIRGREIFPLGNYAVQVEFSDGSRLAPTEAATAVWGDIVGHTGGPSPPDGIVDFFDIGACVDRFRDVVGAPTLERADLYPDVPDGLVDFNDIRSVVDAFRGFAYPFPLPNPCP